MNTARQNVASRKRPGFTLVELLVCLSIIAILIAFLAPARRDSRQAAGRSQCRNNLKQIGLAIHNYQEQYGCLPPAYTVDSYGRPLHSWRTLLLPYLDQKPLYEMIDLSKPWDDPANAKAYEMSVPVFQCPSANIPTTHTTYVAIVGENHAFHPIHPRKLSEYTDGTVNTAMVVEVAPEHAVHWMAPDDTDGRYLVDLKEDSAMAHAPGTHVLLADGSVRYISFEVPVETRRALGTIAGNDNDDLSDF